MNEIKNILFDLDGTIIEPEEGIVNSVVFALNKLGIDESDKKKLTKFIGPPLIKSFANFYELSDKDANKAVQYYREFFGEKGLYQNFLYDDIKELLEHLQDRGFKLFVATSKPTIYAKKIIKNFNLDKKFEGIIGSNLDNSRTDKTEVIQYVLNSFDLNPQETIMIGDRKFDMIGAKNNNLISIGVTYGHGNIEELKKAKADFIVNSCQELQSIFI